MQSMAIGDRFGKLVILEWGGVDEHHHRLCVCRCDCGKITKVSNSELRRGKRLSCGCLRYDTVNGRRKQTTHTEALDRFLCPGRRILA